MAAAYFFGMSSLGWLADARTVYPFAMSHFNLQTSPLPETAEPPEGYGSGWVRVGELNEAIFFSTRFWSAGDYAQHWNEAAQKLLRGEQSAFCTDFSDDNAALLMGFPSGSNFEFEEWIVPRHLVQVDGLSMSVARMGRSKDASCWSVSADAIKAYAQT